MAAAFAGVVLVALNLIVIALALLAARAFRREKGWRNFMEIPKADASFIALPFGTITGGILL